MSMYVRIFFYMITKVNFDLQNNVSGKCNFIYSSLRQILKFLTIELRLASRRALFFFYYTRKVMNVTYVSFCSCGSLMYGYI